MTNKTVNHQTKDALTCSILILVSFTLIHSSTTYIFIRIYLWVKHSKTIITAEKSLEDLNILGFKKLLIFISLLCFCMLSTFLVHENKLYSIEHSSAPPPIMVLSAVLAAFLGVFFIWKKPDIRSFVKRRLRGKIESMFPNISLGRLEKRRRIMPKLSRNWKRNSQGHKVISYIYLFKGTKFRINVLYPLNLKDPRTRAPLSCLCGVCWGWGCCGGKKVLKADLKMGEE